MTAVATGSGIRFSWNPGSDAQTPSSGLTYNLRVGTTPGGVDIVSPMSDPASGKTRTPQMGNAQERRFSLVNVPIGQTYYWSVQSVDTSFAGSPFAPEQSIALTNPPPLAVTLPATIVSNFVVLNGSVNPNGTTAAAWFGYGLTTNYDTLVSVTNLVNGTSPQPVSVAITGLVPAHVYHYQISATNAGGPSSGADLTFVSPSAAPEITLVPPSDVTGNSAVLNTAVNPNGLSTFVYFAYGPTLAYGSFTDPTPIAIGATNVPVPLSRLLTGLNPGVTYHYLIYASNALGVVTSPDQTLFTVANIPPSLSTFANVTTALNTPTAAIPFNVSDAQISASNLVVTIMSGNTNLVPQTGFLVTGTGTNRTLTITPASGRSGIVTIVVAVSDGASTTYQGFTLSVGLVPGDTNGDGQVDLDELNTVILYYRHLLP